MAEFNSTQNKQGRFNGRPLLRLIEIERLIKLHRIETPCPTRQTLIRWCEEGLFETVGRLYEGEPWKVYEDSFWNWANRSKGVNQ